MIRQTHVLAATLVLTGVLVGCGSSANVTRTPVAPVKTANSIELVRVRTALSAASAAARALYVEGDITIEQNGETNSASFVLRSKRLGDAGRIDSLSIEVKGPFGIKMARFLASPDGYKFNDILHGETMSGKTDAHALEGLTQLRGLSLAMMSDLAYGLAPGMDATGDGDSLSIPAASDHERFVIQRPGEGVAELMDLREGPTAGATVLVDRYRRYTAPVELPTKTAPIISIRFLDRTTIGGVSIPQHIEASAGENKLRLDYTKIELNPASLIVKIKMPE